MKVLLAVIGALIVGSATMAGPRPSDLRTATPCRLEALFRQSDLGCEPVGRTRGTVLYSEGKHPQLKAHMQGLVWKGKTFHDDGTFTNRWLGGVRAGSTGVHIEPSWLDSRPCFVMQYKPDALVFSNVRDEVRQIAPDEWLGRSCDGCTGELKNWFVLRAS
jgi:hypothetical protein